YHVCQLDGTGVVAPDHFQAEHAVAAFQRRVCIAYIVGMSTMVQSVYHGHSPPTPAGNSRLGAITAGKRTVDCRPHAGSGPALRSHSGGAFLVHVAARARASMVREDVGAH